MERTLFLAGANRGGTAFSEAASRLLRRQVRTIVVADPAVERAERLAAAWREAGWDARADGRPAEQAIHSLSKETVVTAAVDEPRVIARLLEAAPRFPVRWQILARGPGANGPVFGFAGTVYPIHGIARESDSTLRSTRHGHSPTALPRDLGS